MSNDTSVTLGDSLRGLADILDAAPSIQGAKRHPDIPSQLGIVIDNPRDMREIAEALGLPVEVHVSKLTGQLYTTLDVWDGLVTAHIFSISNAEEVGS